MPIGTLSSAESITAKIALNELVTRHSAVLGSTGSGKSTTIASLLRAITAANDRGEQYPNARVLLLDVHGEYSVPLADVAQVFSVEPRYGEERLFIPYWALGYGRFARLSHRRFGGESRDCVHRQDFRAQAGSSQSAAVRRGPTQPRSPLTLRCLSVSRSCGMILSILRSQRSKAKTVINRLVRMPETPIR